MKNFVGELKWRGLIYDITPKTEDYLLLIGDPAAIGVACSIAAYFNRGRFNILKWDRQEGIYYPVEIDLHQKGELDD